MRVARPVVPLAVGGVLSLLGCGEQPAPAPVPAPVVETTPVTLGDPPPMDERTILRGRELYEQSCWRCHGPRGQGDGPDGAKLVDAQGAPIQPRDFTALPAVDDVDARIRQLAETIATGVPRTPMPGHPELTPAQVWELARYLETVITTAAGTRRD